jgi:hypothetical protein
LNAESSWWSNDRSSLEADFDAARDENRFEAARFAKSREDSVARVTNNQIAILEIKIEELQKEVKDKDCDVQVKNAKVGKEKALKEKEEMKNILASIEFEFDQFKTRAKKRENESILCLDEARNEGEDKDLVAKVKELEEKLAKKEENQTMKEENLTSKEESSEPNQKVAELEEKIEDLQKSLEE